MCLTCGPLFTCLWFALVSFLTEESVHNAIVVLVSVMDRFRLFLRKGVLVAFRAVAAGQGNWLGWIVPCHEYGISSTWSNCGNEVIK